MMPATLMTDAELTRLGTRSDAGFGALQTASGALPLCAMTIDARVVGVAASIELAQTFENTLREPLEATYVFPLPDRAAVTRFRLEVAGRVVEGIVDERGAARATYDAAIAAGQRAAIAEEDRAGVFTLRVGNLMPRDVAIVRLTLVGPLPVEDGEVTFRFPLVVAPRYIPGHALPGPQAGLGVALDTDAAPDASRISPPVLLPGMPNPVRLSMRLAIDTTGLPIRDVRASLHQIRLEERAGMRVVELGPGERLDRDFIVRWAIGDDAIHSSAVWTPDAEGGAFLLTLVPPRERGARPRDVVFVLDRSGSMAGWKMVCARRAVARMVDTLGERDRFAVMAFDNRIDEPLGTCGVMTPATDRNRFHAVAWLATVESRGGTEMAQPLARAATLLGGGDDDRDRVVVLVTDGQVGNEDQILRDLAPRLRGMRVFTLGIDQAVNAAFLRRLAAAGGGACELCESEDRLDAVMDKVHRRIATPVVTELAIAGEDTPIDHDALAPRRLPALFAGAPVVIAGRLRAAPGGFAAITVTGKTPAGAPWRERITLTAAPAGGGAAITAMWARARIRDLEDRYAISPDPSAEREVIAVSKRHNVLSRFTAFVAVDRSTTVNPGGGQRQIVQAVEAPAGWGGPARQTRSGGLGTMGMPSPDAGGSFGGGGFGGPPGMPGGGPGGGGLGPFSGPPAMPPSAEPVLSAPMPPAQARIASPAPMETNRTSQARPSAPSAPPPPPASKKMAEAASMPRGRSMDAMPVEREEAIVESDAPYRDRARQLAQALEQAAAARDERGLELAIARLAELIEDMTSIDPGSPIAVALLPILDRLRRAIATGLVVSEATVAATELRAVADGPAGPRPPAPAGRTFWK
ncbi:MAG: VWA domain-containing protein [Deltaproteobacteria bacterium]|nr:VWA domain-containing protein [Deltaproteobacteria bacterium]